MALTHDWQMRVDAWIQAVRARIVRPLKNLPAEFATTMDHLTPTQARRLSYRPARAPMAWGRKWEYAWFRSAGSVPKAAKGKAIVLTARLGRVESILFISGSAAGGIDGAHAHIDLSAMGLGGKRTSFLIEAYAGHGATPTSHPFLLPGQSAVPEPPAAQQSFAGISLGEWDEGTYQLYMDVMTLKGLYDCLSETQLRRHRIAQALMDVTVALDVEAEREEFQAGVGAARKILQPLLAARNGETAPEMYAFGHSHIDVTWLWPLAQTYRKNAHTFSTQLALMKRYPEFRFLQSQAQLYDYLKAQYPDVFRRIKRAARRGQWIPDGGMWVEPDTNATGGESLIRQFLYGKRFFREEFGVDSEVCWLPDVFGFSAALPQIIRGCGMKCFSTQKIFWTQHGGTKWPFETFMWQGIDGTEVLTHLHRNYNANTDPPTIQRRWLDCLDKDTTQTFLYPFGWGDGGGGPTRDHLEYLRRSGDLEGLPRTRIASPDEYFTKLAKGGKPKNVYVGELYLELHRGTYTSQARTKQLNRQCEFALREAEMWSAFATATHGRKYPAAALESAWKKALLNQFHDILPGSSIERVYEEAEAIGEEALAEAQSMAAKARSALAGRRGGWSVWNSLSWPREILAAIPAKTGQCAVAEDGTVLPAQPVGRGAKRELLVAVPDAPAVGAAGIRLTAGKSAPVAKPVAARAARGGAVMENDLLRVRINARGEIAELYDKAAGRQLAAPGEAMNRLELYRDNPSAWGAWDIDIAYKETPVRLGRAQSVRVTAAGPLEARVTVRRRLGESILDQDIVLRRGRRIDFETRVDWRRHNRMLKVAFPADLAAVTVRGELQFGHVIRPNHANTEFEQQRFEWPAQKWAAVSEANCGVAILNDCKYGYDFLDGVLRLTLLRAPIVPDANADIGKHEFTYAVLVHDGPFAAGDVVRAAYELNAPAEVTAGRAGGANEGFLAVSNPNIIVETIKRGESGKGVVVRLYESVGASTRTRLGLKLPVKRAADCDMLENPRRKLRLSGDGSVSLRFRPFEIKTIRFE